VELATLSEFTKCLASSNVTTGPGTTDDGETREEASLLMSLLGKEQRSRNGSRATQLSVSSTSRKREQFTFTCPSLSLDFGPDGDAPDGDENRKLPADIMRRPLQVADRDALQLSTDAMARNVHQSFQRALEWRICSWMGSLEKQIVQREHELGTNASETELEELRRSPESILWYALNMTTGKILVTGTSTRFRMVEDHLEKERKRRLSYEKYSVHQSLGVDFIVTLDTPAGHSEVSLDVPGEIQAIFDGDEMCSVSIDLDTDILVSMIEKSCRTIVRTSTETVLSSFSAAQSGSIPEKGAGCTSLLHDAVSIVTPPPKPIQAYGNTKPLTTSVLMPIADEFDYIPPRRISPQPCSLPLNGVTDLPPRSRSPIQSSLASKGLPLISPPPQEYEYQDMPANGPSLPVLVEVACRAMQAAN